jgi:hypothetical protein
MAGQRQAQPIPLQFQPGLYTNETDRGAMNRWIRGDNVRWADGLAEKMGGYELYDLVSPSDADVDVTYMGKARSTWEWDSLDGETWIAFGTACKLYVVNRGVLYDITPMRKQSNVVDGFTTAAASITVTVVDPGHDSQDGDHFRILTDVTVGGITITAGEYDITRVVDLDTFEFEIPSAAVSSATSVGTVVIQYDLSCGLESDSPLYGYGVGPYGEGTYGTARTESTYMGKLRVWSLDNWGEDLLASPNGGTLYEWRRVWGPDSRARAVVGAPANIERMMVGPDDRHVIAFGTNLESGNQQHDKMFVRWCKGDDYTVWNKLPTNDAGSKRLDSGSRLITAVKTNRGILLFSDRSLYFVSLIGGTDVYAIVPAGVTPEIISPEAAIDVDGTVYFMTNGDHYMWNGTINLMECDIKTQVFGVPGRPGINKQNAGKAHVRVVEDFNEIWWSYPSANATENDSTSIYNYELKCWYSSSIPRECGRHASPSLDRQPYAFYNNRMWLHEIGADGDDGEGFVEPLHAYLHSYQREVLDGALEARVSKLIPDFDALDGVIDVSVEGRERPQSPIKSRGPYLVSEDTTRVCPDIRVRQVAIVIDSNELGAQWRMGTWSAYATPVTRKSA